MNEFEMADYIDGAREMVFMAMDEHGILCEDGHWMTVEELYKGRIRMQISHPG